MNPALRLEAQAADTWSLMDLWTYPSPGRIGLDLDPQDQTRVVSVREGSPAQIAGILSGDRLLRLGGQSLATATDLMAVLDGLPPGTAEPTVVLSRPGKDGQETRSAPLSLSEGWKRASPAEFAWRPSKWGLSPAPGFGGPVLGPGELAELGLGSDAFAFRVTYLVTWGENKRWGQAAAKAGLRKGQVILGAAEKRDFESIDHFHAWWRLTRKSGEVVQVIHWEDGQERLLTLPVGS